METSPSSPEMFFESALKTRINQASNSIPRILQWRLFIAGLIISDILMSGLAFRLAYFLRFELSLGIFYQNINPPIDFYQRLVFIFIPLWLFIFAFAGIVRSPEAAWRHAGVFPGLQRYNYRTGRGYRRWVPGS
jgi:hypothetical protein